MTKPKATQVCCKFCRARTKVRGLLCERCRSGPPPWEKGKPRHDRGRRRAAVVPHTEERIAELAARAQAGLPLFPREERA